MAFGARVLPPARVTKAETSTSNICPKNDAGCAQGKVPNAVT
jgi:hypothetical protein